MTLRQIRRPISLIRTEENKSHSLENKEIVNNLVNKIVLIKEEASKGSNNSDKDLKESFLNNNNNQEDSSSKGNF